MHPGETDLAKAEERVSQGINQSSPNTLAIASGPTKTKDIIPEEEFEKWLADYGQVLEANMEYVRQTFEDNEINYQQYDEITALLDDPKQAIRDMYNGKYMKTYWKSVEERYFNK